MSGVGLFLCWCDERELARAEEITRAHPPERYRADALYHRQPSGRPLTRFARSRCAWPRVRSFFGGSCASASRPRNPASDLEMRASARLPKHVLTADEAERVLAVPKQDEVVGLRDRTMLELFTRRASAGASS